MKPQLKLITNTHRIAIAGPSPDFIRRGRNPDLEPPRRFKATVKQPGDIVL